MERYQKEYRELLLSRYDTKDRPIVQGAINRLERYDQDEMFTIGNIFNAIDSHSLPEKELLSGEAKKQLDRAIQSLPEKLRIVFLLRDVEGLSIKETSEALNLTETAVKTRLLRARLYLREQLSIYFGERMAEEK